MESNEKPIVARIKEIRFDILFFILSIIQGLAFTKLLESSFDVLESVRFGWYSVSIALHAILCFFIIIRLFETIFLGFLDYDEAVSSIYEVILIFLIGAFEYWLIDSLNDFSAYTFYSRLILLAIITILGYTLAIIKVTSKSNRQTVFSSYSAYRRELLLQLINLSVPLILLVISILVLKGIIVSDFLFSLSAIIISILILVNTITSWTLTVKHPRVIEPWNYEPFSNEVYSTNTNTITNKESIQIAEAESKDSISISELFLSSFPYVFRDLFQTTDKRIIRILSRLLVFRNGNNVYGFRNIYVAKDTSSGKVVGFVALSTLNSRNFFCKLHFGFYLAFLVFFHSDFFGLPRFLKNAFRNRKAVPKIKADELYISYIGVAESFRKKGIAKELLSKAQKIAGEQSKISLGLDVRSDNTNAIQLFLNFGLNEIRRFDDNAFGKTERIYMSKTIN